jgi:diadenosine tetraphosphate (Ap4A) HIT family hydrolase
MSECFFCNTDDYIFENELAKGRFDDSPVSEGHMLFVTKRCVSTFFDTTTEEKIAIFELIEQAKKYLDEKYHPDGYNIGMNCGEFAGQSVMHVHVHLIPRYKGDVENPRGGVRGIIPSKQNY